MKTAMCLWASLRLTTLIFITWFIAGCATSTVADSDPVDSNVAYVVLNPKLTTNFLTLYQFDATLVCLDEQKRRQTIYLPKLDNFRPTVVTVRPGVCYLDGISTQMLKLVVSFKPETTVFEARRNTLSYPGDWPIKFLGSGKIEVPSSGANQLAATMSGEVVRNPEIELEVKQHYPRLLSRVPIVFTRLTADDLVESSR